MGKMKKIAAVIYSVFNLLLGMVFFMAIFIEGTINGFQVDVSVFCWGLGIGLGLLVSGGCLLLGVMDFERGVDTEILTLRATAVLAMYPENTNDKGAAILLRYADEINKCKDPQKIVIYSEEGKKRISDYVLDAE